MWVSPCFIKRFEWGDNLVGQEAKLDGRDTYIIGENPSTAILIIHDLFSWTFPNSLADHYTRETHTQYTSWISSRGAVDPN